MNPRLVAGLTTLALVPSLALSVGTAASSAAGASCHGVRATIVGQGRKIQGTSHRDVIVSNGAVKITAGGGDDLICITRNRASVRVAAGAGDDTVDNRDGNPDSEINYDSGTGSDRYRGNGSYDSVRIVPDGHDRINTSGGGDYVTVARSPHVGTPVIDLGRGGDILELKTGGLGGHLVGGPGEDELTFHHKSSQSWTVDNQRGVAQAGGATRFRWSGFEDFSVDFLRVPTLSFVGSDQAEKVFLPNFGPRAVDLRTGGGDDTVSVNALTGGTIDLGAGTDSLEFNGRATGSTITADLTAGAAHATHGQTYSWLLAGVENLRAIYFARADLVGDDGPNTLDASFSDDTTADGRGGTDTCSADTTTNCELG